jgi:hypothetical protein
MVDALVVSGVVRCSVKRTTEGAGHWPENEQLPRRSSQMRVL